MAQDQNYIDDYEAYLRRQEQERIAAQRRRMAEESGQIAPQPPKPVDELQFTNPAAYEAKLDNQVSPVAGMVQAIEEDQNNEWSFGTELANSLTFITSPLMSFGDFALAPLGNPANTGSFAGDLAANFKTAGKAFWDAWTPTYGEARPEYGKRAAAQLGISEKWALPLELITDPTLLIGLPALKLMQTGAKSMTTASAFKKGADLGPWEAGLREILGSGSPLGRGAGSTGNVAKVISDEPSATTQSIADIAVQGAEPAGMRDIQTSAETLLEDSVLHGTEGDNVASILDEGLRPGSNVAEMTENGAQSFESPITLVYNKSDLATDSKGYNPGESVVSSQKKAKPTAAIINEDTLIESGATVIKRNEEWADEYNRFEKLIEEAPTAELKNELRAQQDKVMNRLSKDTQTYVNALEGRGAREEVDQIAKLTKDLPDDIPVYVAKFDESGKPTSLREVDRETDTFKAAGTTKESRQFLREEAGFRVDNPSDKWVKGKQAYTAANDTTGTLMTGVSDTATFRGADGNDKVLTIPRQLLDNAKGARGEEAFRNTGNLTEGVGNKLTDIDPETGVSLKDSVAKDGVKNPIAIAVNQNGEVIISEGNHRLAAAKQAGQENVPVTIRYYNGGEDAAGVLNPDAVAKMLGKQEGSAPGTSTPYKSQEAFQDRNGVIFTREDVYELGRLADRGNRKAATKLSEIVENNGALLEGLTKAEIADREMLLKTYEQSLGNLDGPEIVLDVPEFPGGVIPDDLLERSLKEDVNTLGGRINLARSITDSDGGNNVIRRMEEIFREQYRRLTATQTNARTVELAQNKLLEDTLNMPLENMLPEDAFILRQSLVASADNLDYLAKVASGRNVEPLARVAFDKALAFHYVLQAKATKSASRAGRMLQSFNIKATSTTGRLREINDLINASGLC